MKRNWDSSQIIRCSCSELSYTHVHCPCSACKGKAVSSSVEFRHRQRIDLRQDLTSLPETEHEDVEDVASETSSSEATSESDCIVEKEENLACDDSGLNMQTNTSDVQNLEQDIVFALCKGFMLVNQMQGSINDFDEVLVFARDLFCRNDPSLCNLWPKNWKETEKLFKKWDYKEPRMYIICLDDSHPCHWDVMESASIRCRHCNKFGTIKYYYLGLPDKIRTWYSDSTMCKKMLAHWLNKDNWISGVGANLELSEVWDGTRFSELAWFWDPDKEWMLPYKCKYCLNVISVEEIVGFPERDGIYTIQCEDCGEKSEYQPQFARGEPRNIGLIGHWDGWQPFGSPGKHSCGAIEVSIANMNKQDRSAIEEVYVIGFVPNYLLPKKRPCSLDPFLHPLISDIESIFINGYRVDYVGDFPEINIRPGNIVVRVLLLLWTGDYVAQCEIGKFIKCGIKACRRDKLTGTINPNGGTNYYYGQNRFHARFHWEERKISEELKQMQEISEEDRPSIRKRLSRESGYTGLSILHRLHKLYGFDVLKDTVFDVMHNLPLNIVKDQLMKLITDEKFDVIEADERLSKFPWTCELKNGRIPLGLTSRVAHWKSEEWQKFAYPASELILAGLLPPADYHLWQLAVRMTQLIFNHRSQWSHEDVLLFSNLANRYIILNEEQQGITACRITVHNLQHISEDALRFSHPDNYWCFPFERAVQRYVSTSSNFKNIECSFAKRESYRELMKLVSAKTEQQRQVPHVKFDLQKMSASSLEAAKHIQLLCHSNTEYAESFQSGVLIGGMLSNDVLLSEEEMDLIKHSLSPSLSVPELGFRYRAFWKPMPSPNGMLFRKNECVILKDDDGSDDEVVCQVEYYLCVQVDNSFVKFVKVSAYSAELDEESNTLYDPYSGGMFIDTTNVKTLLAPATSIDRKVILYNCNDDAHPNRGIVVDFQREVMAITYSDIQVPFYPKCEDMVLIKGDGPDPWLAKVLSIQENRKTAKVWYYREHLHRQHLYVPYPNQRQAQDFVHWDSILCLAPGENRGSFYEMHL